MQRILHTAPNLLTPLLALALTNAVLAQDPVVLLRTAETVTVDGQSQTISHIRHTATSACAGYACSVRTFGPLGGIDLVWGALTGGAPDVLRAETTAAGLLQVEFDSYFELSAAGVAHAAVSHEVASGMTGMHGAWLDGDPIALSGTPAPGGMFWRTIEDAGATLDGRRWFRASLSSVPFGFVAQRGLFVEDDFGAIQTVVLSGASYPNLPAPLTNGAVYPTARFSSLRGRWISPVWIALVSGADSAMIADGAGLVLGGTLVHESQVVPPSVGGIGDRWDRFSWCGINEAGEWFFAGDTSGAPGHLDDFLCRNDGIWLREGDDHAGETLVGPVRAAGLNASGELAFVWGVEGPAGTTVEALFLESSIVARAGDAVDWDGDGFVDPDHLLDAFLEGTLSIASSGEIYAAARIDTPSGPRDAFVRFPREIGTRYCAANSNFSGGPGSISAHGSDVASDNDFTLRCASMPQQSFGFFLTSPTAGFAANPGGSAGNLCLGGAIGRFQQSILSSGVAAVIELDVDLGALPRPNGTAAVAAGDTWNFSTWFRDSTPAGAPTSNFSDAISVTFR